MPPGLPTVLCSLCPSWVTSRAETSCLPSALFCAQTEVRQDLLSFIGNSLKAKGEKREEDLAPAMGRGRGATVGRPTSRVGQRKVAVVFMGEVGTIESDRTRGVWKPPP